MLHPGNAAPVTRLSLAGLAATEKPEPGVPRFIWGEQPQPWIGRENL